MAKRNLAGFRGKAMWYPVILLLLMVMPTFEASAMRSAITLAMWSDKWGLAKMIFQRAIMNDSRVVDTEEYDGWGYTALCHSLEHNDLTFTEFLLQHGADPNFNVKRVHSSRPIFFAKSVEALELLRVHGADLKAINRGEGYSAAMNLLHNSISCEVKDDRIFEYCLTHGLDPKEKTSLGGNLWHSLVPRSIFDCPHERLIMKAKSLHSLDISPNEPDMYGKSALEQVNVRIEEESSHLMRNLQASKAFDEGCSIGELTKVASFLQVMEGS